MKPKSTLKENRAEEFCEYYESSQSYKLLMDFCLFQFKLYL